MCDWGYAYTSPKRDGGTSSAVEVRAADVQRVGAPLVQWQPGLQSRDEVPGGLRHSQSQVHGRGLEAAGSQCQEDCCCS